MATPHGSKAVIFLNGADVSGYFDDATSGVMVDSAETTTFGKKAKTYIPGQADASFSLSGKFDGDAGAIDEQIQALIQDPDQQVLWLPGGDGFGNRGKAFQGALTKYEVHAPVKDVVSTAVEFQPDGGADAIKVLHAMAAEAATMNGTALDNAASSANGGVGYLHAKALTGTPNAVVKIQHSSDNITFSDLITFANITAVPVAQRIAVAGTVNRYVRAILFSIGGTSSVTYNVAFARL